MDTISVQTERAVESTKCMYLIFIAPLTGDDVVNLGRLYRTCPLKMTLKLDLTLS